MYESDLLFYIFERLNRNIFYKTFTDNFKSIWMHENTEKNVFYLDK